MRTFVERIKAFQNANERVHMPDMQTEMEVIMFIGACKYCGQIGTAEREYASQEDADYEATYNYSCYQAKQERGIRKRIQDARDRVNQLFLSGCESYGFKPIADERVIELLYDIVEDTARSRIRGGTVSLAGGGTCSIGVTSKAAISVKRAETRAYKLEE